MTYLQGHVVKLIGVLSLSISRCNGISKMMKEHSMYQKQLTCPCSLPARRYQCPHPQQLHEVNFVRGTNGTRGLPKPYDRALVTAMPQSSARSLSQRDCSRADHTHMRVIVWRTLSCERWSRPANLCRGLRVQHATIVVVLVLKGGVGPFFLWILPIRMTRCGCWLANGWWMMLRGCLADVTHAEGLGESPESSD